MRKLIFILLAQSDTKYTLISSAPKREVAVCKMRLPKGCNKGGGRESVKYRLSLVHLSIRSLQGLRTPPQTDPRCWTSWNALRGKRCIHRADKEGRLAAREHIWATPKVGLLLCRSSPQVPPAQGPLPWPADQEAAAFVPAVWEYPSTSPTATLCFQSSRNSLGIFLWARQEHLHLPQYLPNSFVKQIIWFLPLPVFKNKALFFHVKQRVFYVCQTVFIIFFPCHYSFAGVNCCWSLAPKYPFVSPCRHPTVPWSLVLMHTQGDSLLLLRPHHLIICWSYYLKSILLRSPQAQIMPRTSNVFSSW